MEAHPQRLEAMRPDQPSDLPPAGAGRDDLQALEPPGELPQQRPQQNPGMRCVPVFWNHSDDHDLEEANRLFLVNGSQEVQRFRLELDRSGAPLRTIKAPTPVGPPNLCAERLM